MLIRVVLAASSSPDFLSATATPSGVDSAPRLYDSSAAQNSSVRPALQSGSASDEAPAATSSATRRPDEQQLRNARARPNITGASTYTIFRPPNTRWLRPSLSPARNPDWLSRSGRHPTSCSTTIAPSIGRTMNRGENHLASASTPSFVLKYAGPTLLCSDSYPECR